MARPSRITDGSDLKTTIGVGLQGDAYTLFSFVILPMVCLTGDENFPKFTDFVRH